MNNEFEDSFDNFSKEDDMFFIRSALLQQSCELQDLYEYIFDTHKHFQNDKLTRALEYTRLALLGLGHAFDDIDDQMLESSEAIEYTWKPEQ